MNVFLGAVFSEVLPASYFRRPSGAVFIVFGVAMSFEWVWEAKAPEGLGKSIYRSG